MGQARYTVAAQNASPGANAPEQVPMVVLGALDSNGLPQPAAANPSSGMSTAIPILDAYQSPVVTPWTSATTVNTAVTMNTQGMDSVAVTVLPGGTLTAGTKTYEVTFVNGNGETTPSTAATCTVVANGQATVTSDAAVKPI